jgi:RimJ/RimL family protein N-acetyltransferase
MTTEPLSAATTTTLADGRRVLIRPLAEDDEPALTAFGAALRPDDWRYLDLDLQNPAAVARLVMAHAATNWRQLVAVLDEEIVGYANVRLLPGWKSHVGDIHLVVGDAVRGQRLGSLLAEAVVAAGRDLGVAKLVLEMLAEQSAGRTIFERLGFSAEGLLVRHARDGEGRAHDLVLISLLLDDPEAAGGGPSAQA